jgi:hypothetical protein
MNNKREGTCHKSCGFYKAIIQKVKNFHKIRFQKTRSHNSEILGFYPILTRFLRVSETSVKMPFLYMISSLFVRKRTFLYQKRRQVKNPELKVIRSFLWGYIIGRLHHKRISDDSTHRLQDLLWEELPLL